MQRHSPLKPGKPLARKTPMRSGKPLGGSTAGNGLPVEPRRTSTLKAKSAPKTRYRSTGPIVGIVDAVYDRAQHSCEICAIGVGPERGTDHHVHHRRPRRSGGSKDPATNSPSNLLLLCPNCHAVVESHRAAAIEAGWLLHAGDDPAAVAVLIERGCRYAYLAGDGTYSPTAPECAA